MADEQKETEPWLLDLQAYVSKDCEDILSKLNKDYKAWGELYGDDIATAMLKESLAYILCAPMGALGKMDQVVVSLWTLMNRTIGLIHNVREGGPSHTVQGEEVETKH